MSNPQVIGAKRAEAAQMNFSGTASCRTVQISNCEQGVTLCATSEGIADCVIERLVRALNLQSARYVIFPTENQMLRWLKSVEKFSSCRVITRTQIVQAAFGAIPTVHNFEERAV